MSNKDRVFDGIDLILVLLVIILVIAGDFIQ